MIKVIPFLYTAFTGKAQKPKETKVFHTNDYKTFDTVVVKLYPDDFDSKCTQSHKASIKIKNYKGYTKQDVKKTPAKNIKLDPNRGITIEFLDKNQAPVKEFRINAGHDASKNAAVLERWQVNEVCRSSDSSEHPHSSTVWIKIPTGKKFVKPRAELTEDGKRVARIVLNEKGENIASERDEYSPNDMKKLYNAIKSLISDAKDEGIDFPYDKVQMFFKGVI